MEDKYFPVDVSGEPMPELDMTRESCMAQLDVCGAMLAYVNKNIDGDNKTRQLLNEATFKVMEAYKAMGNQKEIK